MPPADIADERRLQCGRAKRIQTEHFERIAVPRQGDLELEHRTCQIHGWIARERNKEVLRESLAGTPHHDVGLADQPFRSRRRIPLARRC